jgi:hypothetical protein
LQGKVVSLAGRLPQIWADPTTTDAQRKALLRCLIEKVVLDRGEHDVASVRVVWRGGAVTNLEVKMKVNSIARSSTVGSYRDALRMLILFAAEHTQRKPCALTVADLDRDLVLAFLDNLEQTRKNTIQTRNARLAGGPVILPPCGSQ